MVLSAADIKAFCRTLSNLQRLGMLSVQEQKTLCGLAKGGDPVGAMKGLFGVARGRSA